MTEVGSSESSHSFGHAVKWSVVMSLGNQLTNTIAAFVIAGILGPEAFGTVALAIVFLLFSQLFLEQGLTTTIIQRDGLDRRHLDAAFWMVQGTGAVLFVGTLGLAGWWADVNNAPDLQGVLLALSPVILIEALTVVQQALLQRSSEFKLLATRANTAAVIGGVVGVVAALAGAGVWALVAQQLVTKAIALILLWVVGSWRPGLRFSRGAVVDLWGFSTRVFVGKAGTFAQSQLDSIFIGVSFGPLAVGLYRMALRISRTIVDALSQPVALASLPAFSRIQHSRTKLDKVFREAVERSAGMVIPVAAGAAAVSDLFFRLLGDEWSGAAPVLVVFAALAVMRSVNNICGPLLMAGGRPGTVATLSWSLAGLNVVVFLTVASLVADRSTSTQAVAMALARTVGFLVVFVPFTFRIAMRSSGTRARRLLYELLPVLASAPAIIVGARIAVLAFDSSLGDLGMLIVAVACGGLAGGAILVVWSPLWRDLATKSLGIVRRGPLARS